MEENKTKKKERDTYTRREQKVDEGRQKVNRDYPNFHFSQVGLEGKRICLQNIDQRGEYR